MPGKSGLWIPILVLAGIVAHRAAAEAPSVVEAVVCRGIDDRMPVAEADSFEAGVDRIYCWTRVTGGAGSTLVHAWIHEGVTRARVELAVGSDDWRTYSSKRILPAWTGEWEVKILTPQGAVLATVPFRVR